MFPMLRPNRPDRLGSRHVTPRATPDAFTSLVTGTHNGHHGEEDVCCNGMMTMASQLALAYRPFVLNGGTGASLVPAPALTTLDKSRSRLACARTLVREAVVVYWHWEWK